MQTSVIDPLDQIVTIVQNLFNSKKQIKTADLQLIQDLSQKLKSSIINTLIPIIEKQDAAPSKQATTLAPSSSISYAAAVKRQQTSTIYIPPDSNSKETPANIEKSVCQLLKAKNIKADVHRVNTTEKGGMVLKLNSSDDVTGIAKTLNENLGFQAKPKPLALPKITISRIPETESLTTEELKKEIFASNPWLANHTDAVFDILFTYKPKDFVSAVCKVSPQIRNEIIEKNNSLKIGVRLCPVKDRFHVPLCTKCCKFGHKASACSKDTPTCCLCASVNHSLASCPHRSDPDSHRCANCLTSTNESHHSVPSHNAFDKTCPIYREHLANKIKHTNWGAGPRPTI